VLQELAGKLAIPGLPDWAGLVVLLVLGLVGLAYLLMPFSVFGVKGRLDAIETQLDEIQTEIRTLALRMPEAGRPRRPPVEDDWAEPVGPTRRAEPEAGLRAAPPVPPPAAWPDRGAGRAEPRVEWPRDRR
jgi:hypothetical protein